MNKELLTPNEIAKILKVSPRTFRDYIDEYELPFIQIGKRKRFELSEVLKKLSGRGERLEPEQKTKSKITLDIKKPNNKYRELMGL